MTHVHHCTSSSQSATVPIIAHHNCTKSLLLPDPNAALNGRVLLMIDNWRTVQQCRWWQCSPYTTAGRHGILYHIAGTATGTGLVWLSLETKMQPLTNGPLGFHWRIGANADLTSTHTDDTYQHSFIHSYIRNCHVTIMSSPPVHDIWN